jgi:hypothetical protein
VLASSQVQIASGSGTVSIGARLGGYSGGIPSQGYTAEIVSDGTVNLWRISDWSLLRLVLISKSPARSVQFAPRLVELARLKSSLVGQPDDVFVGVGGAGGQSRSDAC